MSSSDGPPLRFREWLAFWSENVRQSYRVASEHNNLAAFVGPIVTVFIGVLGASALTTNKYLTVVGAGIGLIGWFGLLMLFVTPAKMWAGGRAALADAPLLRIDGEYAAQSKELRLAILNRGQVEAQKIQIRPFLVEGFPWLVAYPLMNPISSGDSHFAPSPIVERVDTINCECTDYGRPDTVGEFLERMEYHRMHTLKEAHANDDLKDSNAIFSRNVEEERFYIWWTSSLAVEAELPMVVIYSDAKGRSFKTSYTIVASVVRGSGVSMISLRWEGDSAVS